MQQEKVCSRWSELNEATVPEEMQQDKRSEYWIICDGLIRDFIRSHFLNVPLELQEEMVQETLLSVYRGLPTFRYQSKFTTWLATIARYRSIDVLRRRATKKREEIYLHDSPENDEGNAESVIASTLQTPEEIVLTKEYLCEAIVAIEVFLHLHGKVARNREILYMVLINGHCYEEAAQALGISAPVVGHVVRSARSYLHTAKV